MIIRLIAIDPRPRRAEDDIIVYQVPEHSRAHELLAELLNGAGIEWAVIGTPTPKRKEAPQ